MRIPRANMECARFLAHSFAGACPAARIARSALFFLACLPAFVHAQELLRGPYIQNLDHDSVAILWRTDDASESWVGIREKDAPDFTYYFSNVPAQYHQIEVPGLKSDTDYDYKAGWSRERLFPELGHSFRTFPDDNADQFSFVVYGDHRNYPEAHRSVVKAILAQTKEQGYPRFILDTGDFTGQGEHTTDFWDEQFFGPAAGLVERVCYFPVVGNHESNRTHPRIPFRYLRNFEVPTQNSGTEYYYSFDYGDAHFVMLDVYATDFATGSKQWEWLRRDLKQTKKRWRFAVMHYPIYIHRSGPTVSYGNEEVRAHLVPLFEQYGITAVFSGDSHFYQRSDVNGIHYICSGGGGAPLYDPGDGPEYVRSSAKTHHYVRILIDGDEMHMTAFDAENKLLDEMKSEPRAPELPEALPLNFTRQMPADSMQPGAAIIIESTTSEGNLTATPLYAEGGGMAASTAKSAATGLQGKGSRFSENTEPGAWAEFTPALEKPGKYVISVTIPAQGSAQAPNSYFEVKHGGQITRGRVDLSYTQAGDKWHEIGLFELAPGNSIKFIEVEDEPGRFYSDAVRFILYE